MELSRLALMAFAPCVLAGAAPGQRLQDCPIPSPRIDAADAREVAWSASLMGGAAAQAGDELRRTLARLRRPANADEQRAQLFVLQVQVAAGAVSRLPQLVAASRQGIGAWRDEVLRRLVAKQVLRAPVAWPVPEVTVEDQRPAAERAAQPLPAWAEPGGKAR